MTTQIDKVIAIDVETSGFDRSEDITRNHQIVSIGLIVADDELKPVDTLYLEIKWNGTSHWSPKAQEIHGLSVEYLDENGVDEEDAAIQIAEFILKHYEPEESIVFLGHNPRGFDVPFFKKLLNKYGMAFKIAHRTVDSFSVGYVCLQTNDSDELFSTFYPKRKAHNALEDASMALGVCRKIRKIFKGI